MELRRARLTHSVQQTSAAPGFQSSLAGTRGPLYLRKQDFQQFVGMSAKGQERTLLAKLQLVCTELPRRPLSYGGRAVDLSQSLPTETRYD